MTEDVFTQHVLDLDADLTPTEFQLALDGIWTLLQQELRRRGIFGRPPSYLGYSGKDWLDPLASEEASHDCYCFAVLHKLQLLKTLAAAGKNIDGFVHLNIRHFVTEKQEKHDPIGYKLFKNLQATLKATVEKGLLNPDGNPDPYTADTVFTRPGPGVDPVEGEILREALLGDVELAEDMRRRPKPILITLGQGAQLLLGGCVNRLVQSGIKSFRLRDLKDCLLQIISDEGLTRQTVIASQVGSANDDQGDFLDAFRTIRAKPRYEEIEGFKNLVAEVHDCIDELARRAEIKQRLHLVFETIVGQIVAAEEPDSQAELGRNLEISPSTIGEYFQALRKILEDLVTES